MTTRLPRSILTLVLIAGSSGCAARSADPVAGLTQAPQQPARFASAVSRLTTQDTLRVTSFDGEATVGGFLQASDSEIVLDARGGPRRWACADIERIDRVRPRAALGGALVAGLLAIVPAWNACGDQVVKCWVPGMAVYGGLGALIGKGAAGGGPIYDAGPGHCGHVVHDPERLPTTATQPRSAASRRTRMWTGAIIGATAGAVLASTVGQESCLGEPRWHCAAMGGSYGAVIGLLAARE